MHSVSIFFNTIAGFAPPFCVGPIAEDSECANTEKEDRSNIPVFLLYSGVNILLWHGELK